MTFGFGRLNTVERFKFRSLDNEKMSKTIRLNTTKMFE